VVCSVHNCDMQALHHISGQCFVFVANFCKKIDHKSLKSVANFSVLKRKIN
jgi:hypothetical protein